MIIVYLLLEQFFNHVDDCMILNEQNMVWWLHYVTLLYAAG